MAEDFSLCLKKAEIEWAAIHVGYVAEPPCNCILSSCLLILVCCSSTAQLYLVHLLPDFDRSDTVPVPASGAGNRCQVSGFDADDLHHLATLAPMAPGVTKSHAFLGILSLCAFCISLRFLDFETSEFSCSVPRSEEALCDDTPAQVNGGSVRDGTCAPRIWNMGASLTLALEVLDPLKHPVHGNIELGALSICSLDIVSRLNS